jgi:hypothetical protein
LVDFLMLGEVGSLSEREVTLGAGVGSFLGVDAHVIEEVVPFAEVFAAIGVVTHQDLHFTFRLRVDKAENAELLGVRDVLLDLQGLQIKAPAIPHSNFDIIIDLKECISGVVPDKGYFSDVLLILLRLFKIVSRDHVLQ